MAELIINGEPLAVFETPIDSWNQTIEKANTRPKRVTSWVQARAPLNSYIQKWRKIGANLALKTVLDVAFDRPYLIQVRALVIVKICRATERTYDVHNAYCKALFDGFSDAGVWKDDSWMYVPWVAYGWVHAADYPGAVITENIAVIEIYELDRVSFNGRDYILPDWSKYGSGYE